MRLTLILCVLIQSIRKSLVTMAKLVAVTQDTAVQEHRVPTQNSKETSVVLHVLQVNLT
jgi:hypothetical protein